MALPDPLANPNYQMLPAMGADVDPLRMLATDMAAVQPRKTIPQMTPKSAVIDYMKNVASGKYAKRGLEDLARTLASPTYNLPKIPSEYEAAANAAQDAMVNLVLGGSTPSPQMMRGEVDLVENPEAEAIEPAFMGMDTLTSAAVPKALQGYIKLTAKMAPDEQTFIKYLERAGVPNPQKYMTAFHGSPHKFSKFELDKIGTGEGGQAFGHGLYFAENPNTAKSYLPKGADVEAFKLKETGEIIGKDSPKYHDIADTMDRMIANGYGDDFLSQVELKGGNLYEVDIPDSAIDNMLDWDKPLSEQPEGVRKVLRSAGVNILDKPNPRMIESPTIRRIVTDALKLDRPENVGLMIDNDYSLYSRAQEAARLKRVNIDDASLGEFIEENAKEYLEALSDFYSQTGESAYRSLMSDPNSMVDASNSLRKAGIPGIKYLDGGSRAAGEGTRNFVVFDPDIVEVLSRNGEKVK